MNKKLCTRILVALLVLTMVMSILPVTGLAVDNKVLESKNLTAFAKGDKFDYETDVVGDFTIYWSSKSKVDESSKTWDDGYTSDQRISFGGKTVIDGAMTKNAIKFTAGADAIVKIWWVQGGDDFRQVGIYNEAGEVVTQSADQTSAKNDPVYSELPLSAAGTYYVGNVIDQNPIYKVEIVEAASAPEQPETPAAEVEWVKVTDGALTSGEYVMIDENGFAPAQLDSNWILTAQPAVEGDKVTDTAGAVWTLSVEGDTVILTDANGVSVSPTGSNKNGITAGEYSWTISFADGTFSFNGDQVALASNEGSDNKYRAYKTSTLTGNYADGYAYKFTLYKKTEKAAEPEVPETPEVPAALNGYYDVKNFMGTFANLEFVPAAEGAAVGTLIISNFDDLVNGEYDYAWTAENGVVVTQEGAEVGITINLDAMTASLGKSYMHTGNMVAAEKPGEQPTPPSGLVVGNNSVVVEDGYNGVFLDFNVPGTYSLDAADGEENAYIALVPYETISLPYIFTVAEGESITFNIMTDNMSADTIDLVIAEADPVDPPEQPEEPSKELVLGENAFMTEEAWNGGSVYTFTAPEAGQYTITVVAGPMQLSVPNSMFISGFGPVELPYTFTAEAGEVVQLKIGTTTWSDSNVAFTLEKTGGAATDPEQPAKEDLTLSLGDNNVSLKPGVEYNVILTGIDAMYAEYVMNWTSDKVTISTFGSPIASGDTVGYGSWTTITLTVSEEVDTVITLAEYVTPPAPELSMGDNHVEVEADGTVNMSFTATEAGTYVFAPMDGETNAWISIEIGMNMETMSDAPVEIELAAGESINIYVSTGDWAADTVDFTFTKKGGTEPEQPSVPTTPEEILAAAGALQEGEALEGEFTLTGTVVEIVKYNEKYQDVNLYIEVNGTRLYCYGLKGTDLGIDMSKVAVGDTVSVTGVIKNYKGTVEFDKAQVSEYKAADPSNPDNPDNGDSSMLFVMVGTISVMAMGAVLVLRKKEIL